MEPPVGTEGQASDGLALGWLTGIGLSVAGIGIGGIVGFGLHTESLHAAYFDSPSLEASENGNLFRGLTNASIGVAAAGGILFALDFLFQTGR